MHLYVLAVRSLVLALTILTLSAVAQRVDPASTTSAESTRPPNIVLILADDLGWNGVGYVDADFYETPNIDRLAHEGIVFTNAYAAGANCAPSRACLMSGQYTPRHGVYAVDSTLRGPQDQMRLVPIPNKSGLPPEHIALPDVLKSAGYATGIFGKWHLSGKDGAPPTQQGFDVATDQLAPGDVAEENDAQTTLGARAGNRQSGVADPKGVFSITRKACDFMEKNRERPFFAYVAHHAIHNPLQARPETLARFKSKPAGKHHTNALYAACTYDFDDAVGMLLKKIDELGLRENTIVVLTSDNGGTPSSSQEPLRGNKGAYYEGGIREPFIVRWPGNAKPGTKCDVPVINIDLFPTFVEAARTSVPAGKILDGESLTGLVRGEKSLKRQSIFWHFPGYLNNPVTRGRDPLFRTRPVSVIRNGDWKLFLYHEEWQLDGGRDKLASNRAVELYNLRTDTGEHNDLATSNTAKRDELLDDLLAWMKATKALMPESPNPAYKPDPAKQPRAGKAARKADPRP